MLKAPNSRMPRSKSQEQARAVEILRNRIFRATRYSEKEIDWSIDIIRELDSEHPLLRYSERGENLQPKTD